MTTRLKTSLLCSLGLALAGPPVAEAAAVIRAGAGSDAAAIAPALAAFRADLGGVNNGVSTNGGPVLATGRREINWDAAALPVAMPPDFFNNNSKRGAFFPPVGWSSLRVSVNSASTPDRLFGDLNAAYPTQFTTNSPNRLFAPLGGTTVDVQFFVPACPTVPATVSGFGAVFTDVELPDSTYIECYGVGGEWLGTAQAPVSGNAGLSFVGLSFPEGARIARVRIVSGNLALGATASDSIYDDLVAMDDFIYGEPQAAPVTVTGTGATAGDLAGTIAAFRAAIGGANNGVSTNGGPTFTTGRREINWDAAALPVNMPPDFFNNNSKRGAVFATPGAGFIVSANAASGPTVVFGDLNGNYPTQFTTNSPNRLFAAANSTVVDARFFVPSQPTVPATLSAFGAVFTDVEQPGSALHFYDLSDALLASVPVPVSGNQRLSFAGLAFQNGERIGRVRLVSGTLPLGSANQDGLYDDVVAMDDFIYSEPQPAPVVRTAAGLSAGDLAGVIAAFRADIGGTNNGVSTGGGPVFSAGRREINWDAAALPVNMPPDFFNNNSKRGAVFATPGSGLEVSANSATAAERLFGDLNATYPAQFTTNSPNRLFTALGSPMVDTTFFVPAQPTRPATVTAFGAVFTDVELAGSAKIECFDANGFLLATVLAPPTNNAGLSFAGVSFKNGERIARVRLTSGSRALGATATDGDGFDIVAMDDFIYAEPQAAPLAFTSAGATATDIAGALNAFRTAIGGANNGVSTNGGPTFNTGRREINWDAAALPMAMPPDFFNNNSKRGAVFATPGTGFEVSTNSPTASERLFGDLNPAYPTQFTTNSPNRLFTALGSTIVDARFFVPAQPAEAATVGAFGAVFTDVEKSRDTQLEFFDVAGRSLGSLFAPPSGNAGLSFAGLVFPNGERVARVRITSGSLAVGPAAHDTNALDVVVMDDFIYSEPQSVAPAFVGPAWLLDGTFTAGVNALPGLRYTIERNPAAAPTGWTPLATQTGPATLTDTNTAGQPTRFYRAVVPPLP
jgi:hypothetical protein